MIPYILIRRNLSKLKLTQLPEFIEFKEAKTLKEARKYTKKVLKIKKIDRNFTVSVLNIVNKGLTDVSNANKGLLFLPRRLKFKSLKDSQYLACVMSDYNKINFGDLVFDSSFFNKEILKTLIDKALYDGRRKILLYGKDYDIRFSYQGIKLPQEVRYLIEKYYKNCNSLSIRELQTIFYTLEKLNIANKYNYAPISMLKDIKNAKGNILKKNHITFDYEKIKKLSKEKQTEFVYTILAKLAGLNTPYIHKVELQLPEYLTYHEMGHLQDMYKFLKNFIKNIKTSSRNGKFLDEYYAHFMQKKDKGIAKLISEDPKYMHERFPQAMEFIENNDKQEIAGMVSENAQKGIGEFIAETYKRMIIACIQKSGKLIPKNVDELYQEYNGPNLAN